MTASQSGFFSFFFFFPTDLVLQVLLIKFIYAFPKGQKETFSSVEWDYKSTETED